MPARSTPIPGVMPPERLLPPGVPSPHRIEAGQSGVVEVLPDGMEHFATATDLVTVYRAPLDGESLFLALAHQIFQIPHGSPLHRAYANYIRRLASSELPAKLGQYRVQLLESLVLHRDRYAGLHSEEAKMRQYLQDLAIPGFPGGKEVMKFMSQIAKVHVAIYPEGGDKEFIRLWQNTSTIGIGRRRVMRPDGTVHYHYNSVLRVRPLKA
ncbi:hypothetical protein PR048_026847 [Dryococelus australis]|uniref:Uncharacterized protein n=1 Tax=Dryococelus australis TaxID=614101 RepID=A0ABQ9GMG4_9NEOP|nr:hypothetical protein PR048_026847 [Dryococelus australis]